MHLYVCVGVLGGMHTSLWYVSGCLGVCQGAGWPHSNPHSNPGVTCQLQSVNPLVRWHVISVPAYTQGHLVYAKYIQPGHCTGIRRGNARSGFVGHCCATNVRQTAPCLFLNSRPSALSLLIISVARLMSSPQLAVQSIHIESPQLAVQSIPMISPRLAVL